MKKRWIIYLITMLLVTSGIIAIVNMFTVNNKESNTIQLSEKVTDECTEEYLQMAKEDTKDVNAQEEKVSPNANMILKKHYSKCNHTIEDKIELPKELINKTKDEVQEEYENWEIEEFSSEKIVLKQEYNKECGEHYILKDNDGIIAVYQINEEGKEELLDETEIATEYLAQDDLTKIQEGLRINGKKELNKILEDFE